jgi:hypothetical protein
LACSPSLAVFPSCLSIHCLSAGNAIRLTLAVQEERLAVLNGMKAALESMQTQDVQLQKQAEELNEQIAEAEGIVEQQRKGVYSGHIAIF